MFRHFTHTLRDQYGLTSSANIDIYDKVDMFLCILAHVNGYRQVRTLFDHSLHTISHSFRAVLRIVVALGADIIKPDHAYNDNKIHHDPDPA